MTKQEQTLGEKIARLEGSRGFVNNFDSFIDFALFPFLANPTKEQMENFEAHRREQAYLDALLMLGELSEGYHDCLGDMFMERVSHGENGQFFTPETVCEFMAGVTSPKGDTIHDCCCGSGRLPLAGLKKSRENGKEPWLYGSDIDLRCCRMTLLNFCLNSVRGEVVHQDALLFKQWQVWHIDRLMVGGKWLSWVWQYTPETDMDALNAERNKQIEELAYNGVMFEYARPSKRKEQQSVPEDVQPEPVEEVTQEKPLPQIVEPERKAHVQLSFDF